MQKTRMQKQKCRSKIAQTPECSSKNAKVKIHKQKYRSKQAENNNPKASMQKQECRAAGLRKARMQKQDSRSKNAEAKTQK